jgi:hypothetical protein
MYIVLENLPTDHQFLKSPVQILDQYQYGPFGVAYIAPEDIANVDFSGVNYIQTTEEIARATKFAKSAGGTISILQGSEIHDEILIHSMEDLVTHPTKPKAKYTLTDDDWALVLAYFKVIMRLMLDIHYKNLTAEELERNVGTKASMLESIELCGTVLEARDLLHNKFGFSTSSIAQEENNWPSPTVNLSI